MAWAALALFTATQPACSSSSLEAPARTPSAAHGAPVADKCKVAVDAESPLVTEWSASEKAHLEGLLSSQLIAVEYSGCELRIVADCRLPGNYAWHQTTLATDTVNIDSVDELYAKLPIGAVGLETELEHSEYLAVQTTVSGQPRLTTRQVEVPRTGACAAVTHWVRALSVGTFKLFGGARSKGGASLSAGSGEARARAAYDESILREAGVREACGAATEHEPHPQCASPVQLFLVPVGQRESYREMAQARRSGAVLLDLPPPEDEDEAWTLRASSGGGALRAALPPLGASSERLLPAAGSGGRG